MLAAEDEDEAVGAVLNTKFGFFFFFVWPEFLSHSVVCAVHK